MSEEKILTKAEIEAVYWRNISGPWSKDDSPCAECWRRCCEDLIKLIESHRALAAERDRLAEALELESKQAGILDDMQAGLHASLSAIRELLTTEQPEAPSPQEGGALEIIAEAFAEYREKEKSYDATLPPQPSEVKQ